MPASAHRLASLLPRLKRVAMLGLVGGSATLIYAALAGLGAALLPWPAAVVSLAAYAVASSLSYAGHRTLTFAGLAAPRAAPARFAGLAAMGYLIAFIVPLVASDWLALPAWVAIAVTCLAVPFVNLWLLARFVFRQPLLGEAITAPKLP